MLIVYGSAVVTLCASPLPLPRIATERVLLLARKTREGEAEPEAARPRDGRRRRRRRLAARAEEMGASIFVDGE